MRDSRFNGLAMGKRGFTLLELLLVTSILGVLISLVYLYIMPVRKKANLLAGQTYVRSVATSLEGARDPATGALNTILTDCTTGFGERPSPVVGCTIYYETPLDFRIEAQLAGAALSRVVYESRTGTLASLP